VISQHLQNEIVEFTKDLVRIPSTHSRKQEIHNCATYIDTWLKSNGIPCHRQDSSDYPTLSVLPKRGRAPVLLMSHFDVVEADDDSLFQPVEKDGKLYGRGTIDDKYGVALSCLLFREHLRKMEQRGKSIEDMCFGLLFTSDEEIGGANGAALAAHSISTDFFIAIDGGRPDLIVTKEKGIIQLELTARGRAAHAARPWLGRSGFDILVRDYARMQTIFAEQSQDHWHKTMVLTRSHAGNGSSNTMPETATASFDIRYTENDNPEAVIAQIRQVVDSDVTVHACEPVFMSKPSHYLDILARHSGGAVVGFEHGASDARYLSQRGIPGAIWGANGEMSQHSRDEHIVLSSLFHIYDKLDSYFHSLAEE